MKQAQQLTLRQIGNFKVITTTASIEETIGIRATRLIWFIAGMFSAVIHIAILRLINFFPLKDNLPLHSLSSPHGREFYRAFNPEKAELLQHERSDLAVLLPILYEIVVDHLEDKLSACEAISLTTDTWSDPQQNNFMAITYAGLTKDFEYIHVALDCARLYGRHTGEALANLISSRVNKRLPESTVITAVTTDNAANAVASAERVLDNEEDVIRCFAHTCQLLFKDLISYTPSKPNHMPNERDAAAAIRTARAIVMWFHRHTQYQAQFYDKYTGFNHWPGHFITPAPNRWFYDYDMLMRYMELQGFVRLFIGEGALDDTTFEEDICSEANIPASITLTLPEAGEFLDTLNMLEPLVRAIRTSSTGDKVLINKLPLLIYKLTTAYPAKGNVQRSSLIVFSPKN